MKEIGQKLKRARAEAGISQAELARRAGMSQQAIAEIEVGRSRRSPNVIALARALGKPPDYFEDRRLDEPESQWKGPPVAKHGGIREVDGVEFARIPVYDIRFAAGAGAQNDDETPIDHYLISLSLLHSITDAPIGRIAIFQADGDSMEPTINNRDYVFVDRRKTRLTNPGIYAIVFEGDGLLKRAAQHLETRAVTLVSDNQKYPKQEIRNPERLQVVGRVFLSIRRH
jgi:phage repressor protein C with HTH and peptisase S24 domain